MVTGRSSLLAGACGALLLVGCGGGDAPSEPAAGEHSVAPEGSGAEAISLGESLAQIRGHHFVSLELYRSGDEKGAALHAGHPIAEILDVVSAEIAEHDENLAMRLEEALESGATAIAQHKPARAVEEAFDKTAAIADDASVAVLGHVVHESGYRGSVIAALLSTAGHEYEEAVSGGETVSLVAEYQDAYGFVREASTMYGYIEAEVEAASPDEAEEIEEAFDSLFDALPSPEPPGQPVDVLEVEAAAELIAHELEETVGAEPVEESDPEEVVEKIEELLTEIEEAYAAGDADAAAELSAEAYLENYEVIEAEVIELAPDVNEELEPLLGAELRREIQAGAPQEDIESMIERARQLLDEALEALESGH